MGFLSEQMKTVKVRFKRQEEVVALEVDAAGIVIEVYEYEEFTRSTRFDKLCKEINEKGYAIKRYNYKENREHFISNNDVWILITCAGIEMLPATYVNNHLMKIEAYPTRVEVDKWLNQMLSKGKLLY
jgi:acyl-ACP thioesterase